MQRRAFLKTAGAGAVMSGAAVAAAGTAVAQTAAPAVVSGSPEIKWRLASSFPKSLDTIYGAAEVVANYVREATDGKFDIRVGAGGEFVPPFQVLDAVQNNTVEMAHTASYYFFGKDPTFAFDTAVPFGMNFRQWTAWVQEGGGLKLLRDFFAKYNVHNIPCGNTGCQMGGWFRNEVKTVDDLKGLKFRIAGLAGQVMTKLGVVPQQIPGGDIYPSLEKGTIDAAEWVGPYDDEKLGFYKVAKNYYFPGFWEGGPNLSVYVNTAKWAELPKTYQSILTAACAVGNTTMMAKYDALNPAALRRLIAGGAQLRPYPRAVLEAAFKATNDVFAETAAKNAEFKKILDPFLAFRDDQLLWFRVAEANFDSFMQAQSRRG